MQKKKISLDAVGFDFGTTNSSIAFFNQKSEIELTLFPSLQGPLESFRSVLYLEQVKTAAGLRRMHALAGPAAIERYLQAEEKGRLVQSLKSHLASHSLTGTEVFGKRYTLEDLIARMLTDLRRHAATQFDRPISYAMVGRPVRFVGAETPEDDEFAVSRLRVAFAAAGFERVDFEMEPVAAACAYESTLDHDELILIGDFGGGTSDFSVLRVGPGVRRRGRGPGDLLGNSGVGLAGDAFDARIIRKLVSPALGSNSEARSLNKVLPAVPAWIYANLERWHYLSFLRTNNVREILKSARIRALEPEKIEALITLVEEDLGSSFIRRCSESSSNCRAAIAPISTFAMGAPWIPVLNCAFPLRDVSLRRGSRAISMLSRIRLTGCSRPPASIHSMSTACSSLAEAPLCLRCAASSRHASARTAFVAATNLPPLRMGWPCALRSRCITIPSRIRVANSLLMVNRLTPG